MSKRILWAGLFSVILLAVLGWKALTSEVTLEHPVLVALYEGPKELSFRGLHATQDSVVVVGGNKGFAGWSLDGGLHWIFTRIPGADQSQFRSVWAQDEHTFHLVSAGAPSYIYRTVDGGHHWERTFTDTAQATFLDGIAFANDQLGWVYGDPVDGRFKLLETRDGGTTWYSIEGPEAIDGEASFAASNSGLVWNPEKNALTLVTGGTASRVLVSTDSASTWTSQRLDLVQEAPSRGAFGHAFNTADPGAYVFVGGDYLEDAQTQGTFASLQLFDRSSSDAPANLAPTLPYCSDVAAIGDQYFFTGTQGVYYYDSALVELDTTAMHAIATSGSKIYLSGPHGRIATIVQGDDELDTLAES